MENVDFVYTYGMDEETLETRLEAGSVGVLALARDGDAYAVPISYHYEDGRLYLRMSDADDESGDKFDFAAATATATFVVFGNDDSGSWSIVVRGRLEEIPDHEMDRFDTATLNEAFDAFRVFDENVDEVELRVFELRMEEVTGRTTHP